MAHITSFLQKAFHSLESSIILPQNKMGYFLTKVAKSNSYVETLGEHADSLHQWIKGSYEEDFAQALECEVRKARSRLNINYVRLAFDITTEPFWGKTRSLYIFNTDKDKKHDGEFKYLTVCVLKRNKPIPLMALPIRVGEGTAPKTIELLEYCQTLFTKIRFCVFDRGFYIAELIDYLEARKLNYLMLVPERKGKLREYIDQTAEFGSYTHQMNYDKEKSTWKPTTKIVVCKTLDKFTWLFATNLNFTNQATFVWYYLRRWQIETNYRVEDEGHIKSKSAHYLVRYFYFLAGMLFHLLWIVHKNVHSNVPYKKYLDQIEGLLLCEYLGIPHL